MTAFFPAGLLVVIAYTQVISGSKLTLEEYDAQFSKLQLREQTAREVIAQEQATIEALKKQIAEMDDRIRSTTQDMYSILGISEQDIITANNELKIYKNQFTLYNNSPENQLRANKVEIDSLNQQFDRFKKKKVTYFPRITTELVEVEKLKTALDAKIANVFQVVDTSNADTATHKPRMFESSSSPLMYTIQSEKENEESLVKIAEAIYGNPNKWRHIYNANKKLIDSTFQEYKLKRKKVIFTNPQDLILPGQVLIVPPLPEKD